MTDITPILLSCAKCKARPVVRPTQFLGGKWSGKTGWRVFCGEGGHQASSPFRARKADAIDEWNTLQAFCLATGRDPAKLGTMEDARKASREPSP